jgi:hypothetical protein
MPSVDLINGMDFGGGVDLGGQLFGDAVVRTPAQEIAGTGGQTEDIFLTLVETQEDQDNALQLSTAVSASYGLFGGSAKFDLSKEMHVHNYSLSLVIRATVLDAFSQLRDVQFGPAATQLLKDGRLDRFREQFGDFFVRGIQTGGELCAILQIAGHDERDLTNIKAGLEAAGILGSVNLSTQDSFSTAVSKATAGRETKLRHFQIGGVPRASLEPTEMIEHALSFAEEVKAGQRGAFQALVIPYTSVDSPDQPNFVDIDNAKETIGVLMQRRRDLVTRLTSFSFVLGHPEQFDIPSGMDVNKIIGEIETAVAQLAAAASRCVNHPKEATDALSSVSGVVAPLDPLPAQRNPTPATPVPPARPAPLQIEMTMGGVLLAGGWRSAEDLASMSHDDRRNTVIVELSGRTNIPPDRPRFLQQFNDDELIGKAAVYIFILKAGIRTLESMRAMSTDDLRNIIIVENDARVHLGARILQSLTDQRLAQIALGWFNR